MKKSRDVRDKNMKIWKNMPMCLTNHRITSEALGAAVLWHLNAKQKYMWCSATRPTNPLHKRKAARTGSTTCLNVRCQVIVIFHISTHATEVKVTDLHCVCPLGPLRGIRHQWATSTWACAELRVRPICPSLAVTFCSHVFLGRLLCVFQVASIFLRGCWPLAPQYGS